MDIKRYNNPKLYLIRSPFVNTFCISIKDILKFKNLEIGGHTYNAYQPEILYRLFRKFTDSVNGPEWWQERDIRKTLKVIKKVAGEDAISWRNHAYKYDKYTYTILKKYGIRVVSNDVAPQKLFPERIDDTILSLPINTTPDHEQIGRASCRERV